MTSEEIDVCRFLKKFPRSYVSASDISRSIGQKKFLADRNWVLPILRRLEMDELVETNDFGEFRLKNQPEDTTTFKKALETPGAALGDTAIICFDDAEDDTDRGF